MHNINFAPVDFEGGNDTWLLGMVSQVLLCVRKGETEIAVRTTVPKMRAIIRGCSGFATFTATNPEWYKMGTAANSNVNPFKGYDWTFRVEPKKL